MSTELIPCERCGKTPEIREYDAGQHGPVLQFWWECPGCSGAKKHCPTREEAIADANRRVPLVDVAIRDGVCPVCGIEVRHHEHVTFAAETKSHSIVPKPSQTEAEAVRLLMLEQDVHPYMDDLGPSTKIGRWLQKQELVTQEPFSRVLRPDWKEFNQRYGEEAEGGNSKAD